MEHGARPSPAVTTAFLVPLCALCGPSVILNALHETSLVVQWLRHRTHNTRTPGSIPGQGIRSSMPQQRLKIPRATTKTKHTQINKSFNSLHSFLSSQHTIFQEPRVGEDRVVAQGDPARSQGTRIEARSSLTSFPLPLTTTAMGALWGSAPGKSVPG